MNQIKHVLSIPHGTGFGGYPPSKTMYVLTITEMAGELLAKISSEEICPSGAARGGTFKFHIQNKRIKKLPADFDKFIRENT